MKNKKELASTVEALPIKIDIIPLYHRPIFPGVFAPILINDPESINTIEKVLSTSSFVGLCLTKDDKMENITSKDLCNYGTVAKIAKRIKLPDGQINIFVETMMRFKIRRVVSKKEPITAYVTYLEDKNEEHSDVPALKRMLTSSMKELSEENSFSDEVRVNILNIENPGRIADFIATVIGIGKYEQQKILEILDVKKRMQEVFIHIKKELELLTVQKKIQDDVNNRVDKNQREYFLREELNSIKEELGLFSDAKSTDGKKFKKLIDSLKFKGEVKEAVDSEYEKFMLLDTASPEYIISRNYLETLLTLPWKKTKQNEIDLNNARLTLNKEHYGLEDVKKRILEYLAVRKLKKDTKGSIILLVGPPGVGKTSIGHSIAKTMGKPFFRFSVGGMNDEAEIKGHRRTYVGAMPGKIIQGLKIVKHNSPVFMIDEVDKIGNSYKGDPSSALLEVLDPEQNISFRDHYLDVPFDLSNIVFILTSNTLDTIPSPLLDRAEVIKLSGYIDSEKVIIAQKYLIPKSLKKHGLKKNSIEYNDDVLLHIANSYAREAGVRGFEKNIDKIHRKLATEIALEERKIDDTLYLDTSYVEKMLGKPIFRKEDDQKRADRPGVAIGLAWTSLGGDTLLIETSYMEGKEAFKLTGQAGDVMKESSAIAFSWTRKFVSEASIRERAWFENHIIHLHLPEGATPKDGPSAGITMTVAMVSLLLGKTIKENLAMTGELSLTGQVLAIGGLKEKTIAARRNGIKEIIIPSSNLRELEEIFPQVKEGITFYPVKRIEEVIDIVFEGSIFQNTNTYDYSNAIEC
ncbi:MAG: endopeptidase La [Treponema sp.]